MLSIFSKNKQKKNLITPLVPKMSQKKTHYQTNYEIFHIMIFYLIRQNRAKIWGKKNVAFVEELRILQFSFEYAGWLGQMTHRPIV